MCACRSRALARAVWLAVAAQRPRPASVGASLPGTADRAGQFQGLLVTRLSLGGFTAEPVASLSH